MPAVGSIVHTESYADRQQIAATVLRAKLPRKVDFKKMRKFLKSRSDT
jgi:hypothetical protein